MLFKKQYRQHISHTRYTSTLICWCISALLQNIAHANNYSYQQAEHAILNTSYTTQAYQALSASSQLEADAVRNLGLPRIDLNARAYKFHSKTDVPLANLKQNIEDSLSQRVSERMSELEKQGIPSDILGQVESSIGNVIQDGLEQIPDYANLTLDDEVFRPTISMSVPLYTGGLTQSTKQIAKINAQRSKISNTQQQDIQRFELIQQYFNVQLQLQLLSSSLQNKKAMQQHLDNALKLEQQGFISQGQRMQFEVANNNALRLYQNVRSNLLNSQYQLQNLLQDEHIDALTTPLFINNNQSPQLKLLLGNIATHSPLIQKMQLDTQLAQQKVDVQNAMLRPKIFAFGEYALNDHNNWIVGVMASYNLFSGINKSKQIQAAELQLQATELLTERTQQEIRNILFKAYQEIQNTQQSHILLQQNMHAANENLRIQQLSFREDMGTASQVIDAENAIFALNSEIALNAYKYILALATLLQSTGDIAQFGAYTQQDNTDFIQN